MDSGLENVIQIKNLNGFLGQLRNSIFYHSRKESAESMSLIYPAGHTVVCSQLTSSFEFDKVQDPIFKLLAKKGITCITQSPSKRYLAWAEETAELPIIVIEDFKTGKRRLIGTEVRSKQYISMCFNGSEGQQPKILIALTGAPEYTLVVFNSVMSERFRCESLLIERLERTDFREEKYNEVFFFPKEEDFLVVTGRGSVRPFKLSSEGPPKIRDSPFARGKDLPDKDFNPISHCVVGKDLIIGTDTGELLYLPNCEYKFILSSSPGSTGVSESHSRIESMIATSRGFLVGLEDATVLIFERPEVKGSQPYIRVQKRIHIKDGAGKEVRVTSMLLSGKQEYLFVGLSIGQIYKVPFADKSYQEIDKYDSAIQKFHSKKITGMEVCLRKPFVATCSNDRTIKIWNYSEKTSLQISTLPYEEKALALTIHPSGLHLLVAFPDKIRLFNIFQNEIVHFKEIPQKNSTDIKFSNGGHLFAILNNVTVHVYRFYTGQEPKNYQINTLAQNTCMCWEEDDQGLFVATAEGNVLYYRFEEPQLKVQVHRVEGLKITAFATVFNQISQKQTQTYERVIYFSGQFDSKRPKEERGIYEARLMPRQEKDREQREEKLFVAKTDFILTECSVSQIAFLHSGKLFLYSTCEVGEAGSLRMCKYPFVPGGGVMELPTHSQGISCLAVTYDDMYVFSGGGDGLLVTYELRDKDYKVKLDAMDPTEYFLIPKHNYVEKKEALEAARRKKAEENQKKLKIRSEQNAAFERQIEQLRYQIAEKNRSEKAKHDRQKAMIEALQEAHKESLRILSEQKNTKYEAVKKDYEEKLKLEEDRLKELKKNGENRERRFGENREELRKQHSDQVRTLEKEYEGRLEAAKKAVEIKRKELEEQEIVFTKEEDELENNLENEIEGIKDQHETNRNQLGEASRNAQAQNMTKKKDLDDSNVGLQQQKLKVKQARENIKLSRNEHETLQQKKISFAKEIDQRQKTIKDKLTRIHELKKKTQELEKFKFVLDYKIRQLRRDVGPKEDEINKMNEQIDNMTSEIQHFNKTNEGMRIIVKDLKLKKQGMLEQIKTQTESEGRLSSYIRSFESDLSALHPDASIYLDYKELKKLVINFYRKYVEVDDEKRKKAENVDQQKEFMKERAHLETNVKGEKEKFEKNRKAHKKDFKRMMNHNEELIDETNDLIREIKNLHDEERRSEIDGSLQNEKVRLDKVVQTLDKKIKEATEKLNRLEEIRPPEDEAI